MFVDVLGRLAESDVIDRKGVAYFTHPYVSSDGNYKIYSDGTLYVVDLRPRIFRANTRPAFSLLNARIPVDACSVGVVDLDDATLTEFPFLIGYENSHPVVDLEPGEYNLWFEEKAGNPYRGHIGFGPSPTLLLHGEFGDALYKLERDFARILRSKGRVDPEACESLRDRCRELDSRGCRDTRLANYAAVLDKKLQGMARRERSD